MRDLEIRGAGNILGGEQHGHMETVGYDMYVLLNEAVSPDERGRTRPPGATRNAWWTCRCRRTSPRATSSSLSQRLEIYRRIAEMETQEDAMDVTDELIDRFGEPPASVKGLLDVALLRNTASAWASPR